MHDPQQAEDAAWLLRRERGEDVDDVGAAQRERYDRLADRIADLPEPADGDAWKDELFRELLRDAAPRRRATQRALQFAAGATLLVASAAALALALRLPRPDALTDAPAVPAVIPAPHSTGPVMRSGRTSLVDDDEPGVVRAYDAASGRLVAQCVRTRGDCGLVLDHGRYLVRTFLGASIPASSGDLGRDLAAARRLGLRVTGD